MARLKISRRRTLPFGTAGGKNQAEEFNVHRVTSVFASLQGFEPFGFYPLAMAFNSQSREASAFVTSERSWRRLMLDLEKIRPYRERRSFPAEAIAAERAAKSSPATDVAWETASAAQVSYHTGFG
jgi:hypothetical protein